MADDDRHPSIFAPDAALPQSSASWQRESWTTGLLVIAAAAWARWMLGPTLGLVFFIPLIIATGQVLTLAGRVGVHRRTRSRGDSLGSVSLVRRTPRSVTISALTIDLAIVSLAAVFVIGVGTAGQLGQFIVVAAALTVACTAACRTMLALGMARSFAQSIVLSLLLAWVSLPVWMSPYWTSGPLLDRVLDAHPMLAINGVYAHLGDWTHAPLAYTRLTNLNQDVPFALPASIAWCVGIHAMLAIAFIAIEQVSALRTRRESKAIRASPTPP